MVNEWILDVESQVQSTQIDARTAGKKKQLLKNKQHLEGHGVPCQ
jgi:hypothetical protein